MLTNGEERFFGRSAVKRFLLATAIASFVALGSPAPTLAQGGLFGIGPTLPARSWQPQRDRAFAIWNPTPATGVDKFVPDDARPALELVNRVTFRTTGVSRVTRFFGIR